MTEELPQATAAPWACAVPSKRPGCSPSRVFPQAISHRGYKARFPENTMAAFRGAVRAGAHAIETDVHLSRDGVAVLSHDPTLNRCFGVDKRIAHCSWADLARLRVPSYPGDEGMPRLRDLLAWLVPEAERDAEGGAGHADAEDGERRAKIWILLDIKMDDDAQALVDAIAAAMAQVPPGETPWEQRILLGCWNASTVAAARRSLPAFALAHIGLSLSYAHHFLALPGIALNMAHNAVATPLRGARLLAAARDRRRPVFAWTVNSDAGMRWAIRQNLGGAGVPSFSSSSSSSSSSSASSSVTRTGCDPPKGTLVDGVVTDDPALYLALCERYEDELDGRARPPASPPAASAAVAALDFLVCNLKFKLVFLYRRFWLRKLDYLQQTAAAGVKQD